LNELTCGGLLRARGEADAAAANNRAKAAIERCILPAHFSHPSPSPLLRRRQEWSGVGRSGRCDRRSAALEMLRSWLLLAGLGPP
jgi:hypothetical protein